MPGRAQGLIAVSAVAQHARQLRNLCDPTAVVLAVDLNGERHAATVTARPDAEKRSSRGLAPAKRYAWRVEFRLQRVLAVKSFAAHASVPQAG